MAKWPEIREMSLDDVDLQCLFLDSLDRARQGKRKPVDDGGFDIDLDDGEVL